MTRISVEVVPRSRSGLRAEIAEIAEHLKDVDTINIPDLLRFSTRSWMATHFARPQFKAIPHIRAIDLNPDVPLPMAETLIDQEIEEVILITGDAPNNMSSHIYDQDAMDAIKRFKRELPHLRIYAGLDPYRQSFHKEVDYLERKLEAGAIGFFTQPFFDMRMVELYADLLPTDAEIFWGATAITSDATYNYWRTRNHAIFPKSFTPDLAYSRSFASELLSFARQNNQNVCLMPIKVDTAEYLAGIV